MTSDEICNATAAELLTRIERGELSVDDCWTAFHERATRLNPRINAFFAIADAKPAADEHLAEDSEAAGERDGNEQPLPRLPLPIGIKDGIVACGFPATAGSAMLRRYHPSWDAEVVARLRRAGARILGKTSMDEFAMGSSNENPHFGPVRNPWSLDRVPGGSSGGSAAAVAAGLVPWALGSDTGGSIRQPSAFCGISGLKPTYGRVSRRGLIAYASSLDQIGPMARSVKDVALLMTILAGHDPADSTSVPTEVPNYLDAIEGSLRGARIGWCPRMLDECEACVADAVRGAIDRLRDLGAVVCDIELPHADLAVAAYYVIASCEASSNLSRYDGVRYTERIENPATLEEMYRRTRSTFFGPEVKRRILLGTFALSSGYFDQYYVQASKVRRCIHDDYERAWQQVDLIVGPTSPRLPFRIGEMASDPTAMYLEDVFTVAANLAGLPALSIPCGFAEGLPIGLQLTGRRFDESGVLRTGHQFQIATDFHQRRPPCPNRD